MVDTVPPAVRSRMMSAVRGRDTKPELTVRRLLRDLGVGYRLHVKGLPGRPDIVMQGRRKIIEVRGCFWHRHPGCRFAYTPKSRQEFWDAKFQANVSRDRRNEIALRNSGWEVLTIWECEASDANVLRAKLAEFVRASEDLREANRKRCHQEEAGKATIG